MTQFSDYQHATELLQASRRPLFVLLESVDADALGATMALVEAIEQRGGRPTIFCLAPMPEFLGFLLGRRTVANDRQALDWTSYDLAIIPDTGSLERTGLALELESFRAHGGSILNIDHHHVHEAFGTVNLVDEHASAATELVYDLLKLGSWRLTPNIATAILAGLVADTDNFTNAGTTIRSLSIAAECYAHGANVRQVLTNLYRNKPVEALQFWGEVLSRLQRNPRWGIVSTVILQDDFKRYHLDDEAADGIANFMNSISSMRAALVVTELPHGELRGSLRTTKDSVDVSRLAAALGGGGHRKAAGFRVPGRIQRTDGGWRVS